MSSLSSSGMNGGAADVKAYLARLAAPPVDQVAAFIEAGKKRQLAAGTNFCVLGQKTHEVAFIHKGIVRYYVILHNGEESTKDFSFARCFTAPFSSVVRGRPAEVAIAAVTDCNLTVWPYRTLMLLYEQHVEWQKLGRRIAEMLFIRKERREFSLLLESAEQRYRATRQRFAADLDRIPQHVLASYLGIRPQSLSRLKRNEKR